MQINVSAPILLTLLKSIWGYLIKFQHNTNKKGQTNVCPFRLILPNLS